MSKFIACLSYLHNNLPVNNSLLKKIHGNVPVFYKGKMCQFTGKLLKSLPCDLPIKCTKIYYMV